MGKSKTSWFSKSNNIVLFSIGCLFFIGTGYLALLFYQERMLNIDSAGFAFHLAQTGDFCLPLGRWGSLFSQIIPLAYLKLGGQLDGFLQVYSLSFILLQFLGFIIITTVLKESKAGIMYLLTACLTVRFTFYFSASEFAQGLSLCVVIYALMNASFKSRNQKKRPYLLVASLVLIASLYYFHQLLVVPVLFVLVFLAFKNKAFKSKYLLGTILFSLLWFGLQIMMLPSGGYEAEKIPGWDKITQGLGQFFELPSTQFYWIQIKTEYMLALCMAALSIAVLFIKKKWLLGCFIALSMVGYFVLIALTYAQGESPNMYEQYFIVFSLIIGISMVYSFALRIRRQHIILITIPLLLISLIGIYKSHEIPTKRLNFLKHMVDLSREHNTMIAVHPDNIQWGYVWTGWAVPVETLLLSSIDGGQSTSIYITDIGEVIMETPTNGQLYSAHWQQEVMRKSALNTEYFNTQESIQYKYIPPLPRDYHYFYDLIKYDYIWMEGIKHQAKKEGFSPEETISINAAYMALTDKKRKELSPLDQKIMEIRSSFEWIRQLKEKAKKSGKDLEQVIQEDALYIINQTE